MDFLLSYLEMDPAETVESLSSSSSYYETKIFQAVNAHSLSNKIPTIPWMDLHQAQSNFQP